MSYDIYNAAKSGRWSGKSIIETSKPSEDKGLPNKVVLVWVALVLLYFALGSIQCGLLEIIYSDSVQTFINGEK